MVRFSLCFAVGFSWAVTAGASTEYDVPTARPVIKKVVIEENGVWSPERSSSGETADYCAEFVLKESDVLRFFRIARHVSEVQYGHDLEVSRCYAKGHAVLQGGRRVTWLIDRARLGAIWFSDDTALYFHCKKCRNKLYWAE